MSSVRARPIFQSASLPLLLPLPRRLPVFHDPVLKCPDEPRSSPCITSLIGRVTVSTETLGAAGGDWASSGRGRHLPHCLLCQGLALSSPPNPPLSSAEENQERLHQPGGLLQHPPPGRYFPSLAVCVLDSLFVQKSERVH